MERGSGKRRPADGGFVYLARACPDDGKGTRQLVYRIHLYFPFSYSSPFTFRAARLCSVPLGLCLRLIRSRRPIRSCLSLSHSVLPLAVPFGLASRRPIRSCLSPSHSVLSLAVPFGLVSRRPIRFCPSPCHSVSSLVLSHSDCATLRRICLPPSPRRYIRGWRAVPSDPRVLHLSPTEVSSRCSCNSFTSANACRSRTLRASIARSFSPMAIVGSGGGGSELGASADG